MENLLYLLALFLEQYNLQLKVMLIFAENIMIFVRHLKMGFRKIGPRRWCQRLSVEGKLTDYQGIRDQNVVMN